MISHAEFTALRKRLEADDAVFEEAFRQSREIVKLSKKIIYAVHRGVSPSADVNAISAKVKNLRKISNPECLAQIRIAEQEYVEAVCFYELVKDGGIPTAKQLGVSAHHYLLGLCDLSGEIARRAINSAINGDRETALKMRGVVELLYDELMQFDFKNGELRKKFDSIKYDLRRLEDMALKLK